MTITHKAQQIITRAATEVIRAVQPQALALPDPETRADYARLNQENLASQILGTQVTPSMNPPGYALFGQPENQVAVEIHENDNNLRPYTYSVGSDTKTVPAIFRFTQRELFDITLLLTAHPPKLNRFKQRMESLTTSGVNPNLDHTLQLIKTEFAPAGYEGGIVRNLWIYAPAMHLLPMSNGSLRGIGGTTIRYLTAGDILHSLVHRRGPRFQDVPVGDIKNRHYHLDFAGPECEPIEYPGYLDIDGLKMAFFYGGIVSSNTYPNLAQMPVDILLRLEWIRGTNRLFVTPLLRTHGSEAELHDIKENLTDKGGWKQVTGKHQLTAFRYFLPSSLKLPRRFGRRELTGWSNCIPDLGPIGLLQMIAENLAPVGDPQSDYVIGRCGNVSHTFTPGPSILLSGKSEWTGKSLTAAILALERGHELFWVNATASTLDSSPVWAQWLGGTTWLVDLMDAENIILSETGKVGSELEISQLRQELHQQDQIWVQAILSRLLESWTQKGRITHVPFVLHPAKNTSRYLDIVALFYHGLSNITQEMMYATDKKFTLVSNDISHYLQYLETGNEYQRTLAITIGELIAWNLNQGSNHGVKSLHNSHYFLDLDKLLNRHVYSTYSHHLSGGLEGMPNYHFDLITPASDEPTKLKRVRLDLRVRNDELVALFDRLTPTEARAFINNYQLSDILKPPNDSRSLTLGVDGNNNGRSRAKVRQHVRSAS